MENVGEAIKKQLLWQQLQSTAGLLPVPERDILGGGSLEWMAQM